MEYRPIIGGKQLVIGDPDQNSVSAVWRAKTR